MTYTLITSQGCTSTSTHTITVNAPQPTPIAGADSLCIGTSTQLAHATTGGTWTNFNIAFGTVNATGLYTSASVGTDTVFYQYQSNSCPAQAKKVLRNVKPDTAAITGSALVCKGETQMLTPSIPGGTWSSSNNAVATINAAGQVSGISGGTTVVSYTVPSMPGCLATSTRSVSVNAPAITTSQSGATLTATGSQAGATYQWLNCTSNYQPVAGATNPVFTVSSNGQYAVVISFLNCVDTSACLSVTTAGVSDVAPPNPVTVSYVTGSHLLINTGTQKPTSFRVFDAQGKLVKEISADGMLTSLDASNLAKGIYILQTQLRDRIFVNRVSIR